MKYLILVLTIFASPLCIAFPLPPAVRPVESAPKEIGGMEFSVISQAEWRVDKLVLQLRMKNVTRTAILFPTFDSISPVITGPDGKAVELGGGRDKTTITPSILIEPGQVFSYPLDAKLAILKDKEGSHFTIQIQDGTGTWITAEVEPGKYKIALQLRPADPAVAKNGGNEAQMWAATGQTETTEITVLSLPKLAK